MIPHPHRTKGGAPQLGAKGPQQRGPFGPYGADEDGGQMRHAMTDFGTRPDLDEDDGGGLDDEDDQDHDEADCFR
ncbi:hypothetical protein ACIOK4_13205 [Streptomyces bottropensis]|uniref:hypothetical protein n=1 Tax=Streptomyces bottropensis TaxID=42235 RepID=UPI00381F41A6